MSTTNLTSMIYWIIASINAITNIILFFLMIRFYINGVKFYKSNQYKQFNDIQIYELRKEIEDLKKYQATEKDKKISELNKELIELQKQIQKNIEKKIKNQDKTLFSEIKTKTENADENINS